MGEVWRARDARLGRTVALKVLDPHVTADPERRARFLKEARAAAALSHPNIAALYGIGEDQGELFLVFEFVPGESLKTVIGGRPLNPRRAIDLAVQIADALADAEADGIVHRDIKPATHRPPKGNAKILDFCRAAWTTVVASVERRRGSDVWRRPRGTRKTRPYCAREALATTRLPHRTSSARLRQFAIDGKLRSPGNVERAGAADVQAQPPALVGTDRCPVELDAIVNQAPRKGPSTATNPRCRWRRSCVRWGRFSTCAAMRRRR